MVATAANHTYSDIASANILADMLQLAQAGRVSTIEHLLPGLFNLKGHPYTLNNHFVMSPMFRTTLPERMVLMAGRQVSKSSTLAAQGVAFNVSVPHITTLYVTPLFEQIRRFSANYVRRLIDESPFRDIYVDATTEKSVLQRSFKNDSRMIFSFALLNADRCRGISADVMNADEVQDMDHAHLEIIEEAMSQSEYKLKRYAGTAKTLDGPLEGYWEKSSQAEWVVKCPACHYENVPQLGFDLDAMIGPVRGDESEEKPGVICARPRCRKPLPMRDGMWMHRYKERRSEFSGYHIPQILMPSHYANPRAWRDLNRKREVMSAATFYNEVCGCSHDSGSKLLTKTEIKAAAVLPWANTWRDPDAPPDANAQKMLDYAAERYSFRVLGVDWGGGGIEGTSFTKLALIGWDGRHCDILWGKKLLTPAAHIEEAIEIGKWMMNLNANLIAHDYTGAGVVRETVLKGLGMPLARMVPIRYAGPMKSLCKLTQPGDPMERTHYSADKARTLLTTCNAVRYGITRSFEYDYMGDDNPGLLHDFLALIDEKTEPNTTAGMFIVKRQKNNSDDFAHAVNLGNVCCWTKHKAWPDFAEEVANINDLSKMQKYLAGLGELDWNRQVNPEDVAVHDFMQQFTHYFE